MSNYWISHQFNGEPASSVLFPVISACGVRLLFHLQAKNAELRGQDMSMQVLHTHTEIKFKTRPPRSETDIESGSGPTSTVNGLDQIEGPIDDTRTIWFGSGVIQIRFFLIFCDEWVTICNEYTCSFRVYVWSVGPANSDPDFWN